MRRLLYVLLTVITLSSSLWAELAAQVPVNTVVYGVSYVEVTPASRAAAVAALRQYRGTSRNDDAGYISFEFFEQIGRPGHFAILETWSDQKALDQHGMAAHTKEFLGKLQPIRLSGYDQRPYKTVVVGPAPAEASGTMYVLTHVDVAPQGDTAGLLRRLAEASRSDVGSLRFDVLQHTMRANHFTVIEAWQNQRALDAHAAAAHTKQYRDALQPSLGSPLDERLYKVVE